MGDFRNTDMGRVKMVNGIPFKRYPHKNGMGRTKMYSLFPAATPPVVEPEVLQALAADSNSCLVCGREKISPEACRECNMVTYCSKKCKAKAAAFHPCEALKSIKAHQEASGYEDFGELYHAAFEAVVCEPDEFGEETIATIWQGTDQVDDKEDLLAFWETSEAVSSLGALRQAMLKVGLVDSKNVKLLMLGIENEVKEQWWEELLTPANVRIVGPEAVERRPFKVERKEYCADEDEQEYELTFLPNPGFSCPDYDWRKALRNLRSAHIASTCHSMEEAAMEKEAMKGLLEPILTEKTIHPSYWYYQSGIVPDEVYRKNQVLTLWAKVAPTPVEGAESASKKSKTGE